MALTNRQILEARQLLAEHRWKTWTGDEVPNELSGSFIRYIAGISEGDLDKCLRYLKRWVSARNQNKVSISGSTTPNIDGDYLDKGTVLLGYPALLNGDLGIEIRRVDDGGNRFHVVRVADDKVLWKSNIGASSLTEATWTANDGEASAPAVGGEIGSGWDISSEGFIEPVSGELAMAEDIPATGIVYRGVLDPLTNTGKEREGFWRLGGLRQERDYDGRYGAKGTWVILQTLELELNSSAAFTEADTRWRMNRARSYRGSNDSRILELRHCDPSLVETLLKTNTAETYTNAIYTVNEGLLEGTWHNIHTEYEIDARTGFATLSWYLSKQANDDVHFSYVKSDGTKVVDFFKFDAADTGLSSFETDYWIDGIGNWYISTDGVNFTKKNGVEVSGLLSGEPEYGATLANVNQPVGGRTVATKIGRSETTRFYMLHCHIEFEASRDYSLVFYKDSSTQQAEIVQFTESSDVEAFAGKCYMDTLTGAVQISDSDPGGNYVPLNESVDGRMVKIEQPVYDDKHGVYRLHVRVLQLVLTALVIPYQRSKNVKEIEFRLFGASRGQLLDAVADYYFSADGDWFYSTDGVNYTQKNGEPASGLLADENAFNINQGDTYADSRKVTSPLIERNPVFSVYTLMVRLTYTSGVAAGNTAIYGTPLVTITDKIVSGVADLPDVTGDVGYNAKGTKITETRILDPRYDDERDTFSYIHRKVEKWAQHADQGTGDAGYIEGPSQQMEEVQPLTLGRGVHSGYGGLGPWAPGLRGRIREVSGSDGTGGAENAGTVQISAKFQPYNITLARKRTVQVLSRLYYYVKEPQKSEYPTWESDLIEDKAEGAVGIGTAGSTFPVLDKTEITDDTGETFGGSAVHYDSSDVYGVLVKHTYNDGTFTLIYYEAKGEYGAAGDNDNVTWRDVKFIRTYPATGAGSSTGYGDGTVRVDEAGLKADPTGTLTNDDGLYMGHYDISSVGFYTAEIKHQIIPAKENVFVLAVVKVLKTPWTMDHVNKWILNTEGSGTKHGTPPSYPSLADTSGDSDVPLLI